MDRAPATGRATLYMLTGVGVVLGSTASSSNSLLRAWHGHVTHWLSSLR